MLNFGIFLAGLRYLYITYVQPTAQTDIEADEKKVAIMAQQKDAYYQQEQFMVQDIETQRHMIAHLVKKLDEWRMAAEESERAYREEHQQIEAALRKKAAHQSEHIAQHMIEHRALPHALKDLEMSLTEHFAREQRATDYIAGIVERIGKGR